MLHAQQCAPAEARGDRDGADCTFRRREPCALELPGSDTYGPDSATSRTPMRNDVSERPPFAATVLPDATIVIRGARFRRGYAYLKEDGNSMRIHHVKVTRGEPAYRLDSQHNEPDVV